MNYWLVKTEPNTYSIEDLKNKREDVWDEVRNHQARNFIEKMHPGDQVFVYHSGKDKAVVGVAEVVSDPYPDPKSAAEEKWLAIDLRYKNHLPRLVTLAEIKIDARLQGFLLVRQSRLSVMEVSHAQAEVLLELAHSKK